QAEDGIRDRNVNGVQTCALPIYKNNYLSLDPTYKDENGNSLLRMTYDFTDQDRNLHEYTSEKAVKIMKEMGADSVDKAEMSEHYDIVPYQSTHNTGGVI